MKINWKIISQYRNELFGIAVILVMLTHSSVYAWPEGELAGILRKACQQGSMGVDIFLFLSGMGLFFSLKKDGNIRNFYLKRVKRVIIPYFLIAIPGFIVLDLVIRRVTIKNFLVDIFLVPFWQQGDFILWYISFIIFLYLIYPTIYFLFLESEKSNFRLFICFLVTLLLNIWGLYNVPKVYDRFEIALARLPLFIVGCWGGKRVYEKKKLSWWFLAGTLLMFIALKVALIYWRGRITGRMELLITRGSFGVGAVSIIFFAAMIMDRIDNERIGKALRWLGGLSLEIYLIHMLGIWINLSIPFGSKNVWIYFVVVIPVSLLVARIYEQVRDRDKRI